MKERELLGGKRTHSAVRFLEQRMPEGLKTRWYMGASTSPVERTTRRPLMFFEVSNPVGLFAPGVEGEPDN